MREWCARVGIRDERPHVRPKDGRTWGTHYFDFDTWATSLSEEPDFYGLLVPSPGSVLPVKSMSRDAALLFMTLRHPAVVPHLLAGLFAANAEERIRELVLDGVFEVEQAGRFISGPAAFPFLANPASGAGTSRIAQLSSDAIAYASVIDGLSPSELASRLYMFNRCPNTRQLQQKFGGDDAIVAYLTAGTATAKQLELGWAQTISQDSWIMWRTPAQEVHHGFKLYISPTLDSFPHVFQVAIDTFIQVRCSQFKVGRTAFGLQRPDKFVAYFHDLEQLQEATELIRASAAGMSAQGVPFTAAIDQDGLVSWGMDPPRFEQVLASQEHQSWRQWVAERIAVYTATAKEAGAEHIVDFVLHRVGLDGIDTATWTPNLAIWRERAGTPEEVA